MEAIVNKMRKAAASGFVALLAASVLTACGDEPEESNDDTGSSAAAPDFLPCIVSDAGG